MEVFEGQDRLRWELDSMFTTLESEEVFEVIRAMQDKVKAVHSQLEAPRGDDS